MRSVDGFITVDDIGHRNKRSEASREQKAAAGGFRSTDIGPRPKCSAGWPSFLPAWMLIGGALPFWSLLRRRAWTQAALRGANAAVVGVLLAALYNPVWREGVTNTLDVAAGLVAFALLPFWRTPPWLAVILCAAAGQWVL